MSGPLQWPSGAPMCRPGKSGPPLKGAALKIAERRSHRAISPHPTWTTCAREVASEWAFVVRAREDSNL